MRTIGEAVKQLIRETPFLEEALDENLVNISSLARKLKPQVEKELHKKVQTGAIVMAIKRYDPGYNYKIKFGIKQFVSSLGDLIVQSGLMHYTYENSSTLAAKHRELISRISGDQIYYSVSRGIFETTVVVSNSTTKLVEEIFAKEKLIFQKYRLSSITLRLPKKRDETTGFFYYILKNLALENINIEELISTTNEFTILVSENDIDRAFSILMKLKKSEG
jgi:aspartokinase